MRTVSVPRPKKKLGRTAIVAMKRHPKNGRIVNQEWWDYQEFEDLIVTAASTAYRPTRTWKPWLRWLPKLGVPDRYARRNLRHELRGLVLTRLEEDRNRK